MELRPSRAWWRRCRCWIGGEDLPPDGLAQRRRKNAVCLHLGSRGRSHLVERGLDVCRAELCQLHGPQGRDDVHSKELAVSVQRPSLDPRGGVGEPVIEQIPAKRELARVDVQAGVQLSQESRSFPLGILWSRGGGITLDALLGSRVEAG